MIEWSPRFLAFLAAVAFASFGGSAAGQSSLECRTVTFYGPDGKAVRTEQRCPAETGRRSQSSPRGPAPSSPVVSANSVADSMNQTPVTVEVPGFKAVITGRVGVPLEARRSMAQHQLIDYDSNSAPGYRWTENAYNVARPPQYGSGRLDFFGQPFLPVRNLTTVMLFHVGGETYTRGGFLVHSGSTAAWPDHLNGRAVIFGIDGYAFSAGGGTARNMARYMSERPELDYVYVEYYLKNEAECGPYSGCQMNLITDDLGNPYSQAIILPLEAITSSSTVLVEGTSEAQDGSGAGLRRGVGALLVTGFTAALIGEMTRPIPDQLRESLEACQRDQRRGHAIVC